MMALADKYGWGSLYNGTSHNPSVKLRIPSKIILSSFIICRLVLVKIAEQLSSHNCPIESKDEFVKAGNIVADVACLETEYIGKYASCVDEMISFVGNKTFFGAVVGRTS